MEKQCRKCNEVKSLDDFHRSNNSPDGRQYRCKPCAISAARQYAIDNPDSKKAADAKYGKSEKCKVNRKARRDGPQREVILQQKRDSYYRNHDSELEKHYIREANPEYRAKARERLAKWRENDPRGILRLSLKNTYRITLEEYDSMVLRQQGRCDICSIQLDQPNVDHCHKSGKIRSLLCGKCNKGLGHFRDNPELMRAAAVYLETHGAA